MAVALPCELIQHDLPHGTGARAASKSNCWTNLVVPSAVQLLKEQAE